MNRRWLALAIISFALAGGACDFAPVCPGNTQYDYDIRRCRVLDGGPPDSGSTPTVDSGTPGEDAGAMDDAGSTDDAGAMDDAGSTDDAGPMDDAGGADAGDGGRRP